MKFLIKLFQNLTDLQIFLIIIAVGFSVYFNSLSNGFVGDDFFLILNNPSVHSITNIQDLFSSGNFNESLGLVNNYYKPIVSTVYSLIYTFFADNPFPFHLVQLLMHIINSFLIFLIFKNFFKRNFSFFLSLLFLVHPINTEAVVYIATLQDNLFVFFGLLASYLTKKNYQSFFSDVLIVIFLVLSVLSKETGLLFLPVVTIFNFFFQKRRLINFLLYDLLVCSAYFYLRIFIAHIYFNQLITVPIMAIPLQERIISIPKIAFFYLKTFIFPKDLISFQAWTVKSTNFWDFYFPFIIVLIFFGVLISFGVYLYKKNKSFFKSYLFFFFWFALGLLIHLQVVPLDQTVADRWFYFPMMGLLGLIGVSINYFELKKLLKSASIFFTISILLLISLSARAVVRSFDWKDTNTLTAHDSQINKDSYQIVSSLAYQALTKGKTQEAESLYIQATKLFPSSITFTDLGYFYITDHQPEKGKAALQTALTYGGFCRAYKTLALLLLANEGPKSAYQFIETSLTQSPACVGLWNSLALTKYQLGDKEGAISTAKKTYSIYKSEESLIILNAIESGREIKIQKF